MRTLSHHMCKLHSQPTVHNCHLRPAPAVWRGRGHLLLCVRLPLAVLGGVGGGLLHAAPCQTACQCLAASAANGLWVGIQVMLLSPSVASESEGPLARNAAAPQAPTGQAGPAHMAALPP